MLPRINRLKDKYFKDLYQRGLKLRGEYGMLIIKIDSSLDVSKFAFVVSKKIGNAVQRHRMTRLLREITKSRIEKESNKHILGLYVAYKYCDDYDQLEKDLNKIFDAAFRSS